MHQFSEAVLCEQDRAVERIKADLLEKGIFGSAVLPNLEADKGWSERRLEMIETARVELDAQIAQLRRRQ